MNLQSNRETAEMILQAFMDKDLDKSLSFFTEDAVVYDPHYPIPEMKGLAAIRQGFEWGLGNLEKPGFVIRHFWSDDTSGVIEADTHHVFKGGMELKFDQIFIYEIRDGKISRLRSFVPYPPSGIGGLIAKVTRWTWKLKGKA